MYYAHHYADRKPRKVTPTQIINWAEDEGFKGTLEECIKFLNNEGNVNIWKA
jgi:hypothetical protein